MKIEANDPRWTAYALGELTDENERAELESILQESEEMRAMVEEIRRTAEWLNDGLKGESPAALTPDQRERIEARATKQMTRIKPWPWLWSRPVWAFSGAAACLVLILSVWVFQRQNGDTLSTDSEVLTADLRNQDRMPKAFVQPRSARTESDASELDKAAIGGNAAEFEIAPQSIIVSGALETAEETDRTDTAIETKAVKSSSAKSSPAAADVDTAEPEIPVQTAEARTGPPAPAGSEVHPQPAMIAGIVQDASGGNLPGVTIEVENVETGLSTYTLTNSSGLYNFPGLEPGEYELKAELDGFLRKTYTDVQLAEAKSYNLDFELQVAGMESMIEVVTTAQDRLTESSASTGTVLRSQDLIELPLTSNDVMELVQIMGGVQPSTGKEFDSNRANQSFAGVDSSAIYVQQDGITANDVRYLDGAQKSIPGGVQAAGPQMTAGSGSGGGMGYGVGGGMGQVQALLQPGSLENQYRRRSIYPRFPLPESNTEGYANVVDNPFMEVTQNPLSTFSIDVDTASYSNVRRFLEEGSLPPKDAVRIEELINYFDYDYEGPGDEGPFAAHFEMTEAPWNPEHRLLRIGLKAKEIKGPERPVTNLVFLIDVSGSMSDRNKLPLVQDALRLLTDQLTGSDHVSIVTYAGSTRVALPSTSGDQKWLIYREIDRLRSGGSTAGASGIQLAYEMARRNFIEGGANRVILATDGDFNVGMTNHGDLARLIEEKADGGVYLSALGFGMGNYKDDTLELLANKGRGNYAYIDSISEARKVLVEQINATLIGVAKDVKIQVEFNPGQVGAYRLIGYEDKIMPKEDFNDDTKKASVIGAGHAVTAIYEIVPTGKPIPTPGVDPLKYQKPVETTRAASSDEVATVKIRYKDPENDNSRIAAKRAELKELLARVKSNHPEAVQTARELEDLQKQLEESNAEESILMEFAVKDSDRKFEKASGDFKFAASVAAFGMVLRDSPYRGTATLDYALNWANEGKGDDPHGYRGEYIRLLHRAMSIKK